jgi:hypothetical protein
LTINLRQVKNSKKAQIIKTNKKGRENSMEDVKKASGLSTASLVTGIFAFIPGCSLAALICGIIDLVKISKGESSPAGKGKDIAGIVLAVVMPIIMVIIWTAIAAAIGLGGLFGSFMQ